MKKNKLIIGIVLSIVGMICLGPNETITQNILIYYIVCFAFIISGVVLIYFWFKEKRSEESAVNKKNSTPIQQPSSVQTPIKNNTPIQQPSSVQTPIIHKKTDDERDRDIFKIVSDNYFLKYKYEENIESVNDEDNLIEKLSGKGGSEVKFRQEPENESDSNAVAIYLNEEKIGYVAKGIRQDMINDWIKRNEPIVGYINRIIAKENRVTFKIGFYKSLENIENKVFSLIKTRKKSITGSVFGNCTRDENLVGREPGEGVTIEYDDENDSYVVYNKAHEDIGELSASNAKIIEDYDVDKLVGTIESIEDDDEGRLKAKVRIYLIG